MPDKERLEALLFEYGVGERYLKDLIDEIDECYYPELEKARKWDEIVEIMPPSHLYALAEWIDLKYPNDSDPEVQTDLRRLADALAGKEDGDEN